jgi:hypothetical protein
VEAVETAIWLTEVAPKSVSGKRILSLLASVNKEANPDLMRLALKLATGAGKTTVMAMLIAWQTSKAVRSPGSKTFTRGFLIVAPVLTIKDRLQVLQPNDPNSYYKDRELVPNDMLDEVNRAKIVITNYHAFKLRERIEISKGGRQLLREVMNTVGKAGQLGAGIRCVVSVSMLTEGWDANNVTHVLGIRAFGTQLLCEQVIGRALRRQSYQLNEKGLFNVEYADVFSIPFDFTAKPVIAPPQKPRETIRVKANRPERDDLEIRFPRVEGYRVELPEERLEAKFDADSTLELSPELVGPSIIQVSGIIGETADMSLEHLGDLRPSSLLFHLTKRLVMTKWRDPGEEPKMHLFGQLKRISKQWLDTCLVCKGNTYPGLLMYQQLADMACSKITNGITAAFSDKRPIKALLEPYNPTGSTTHLRINYRTSHQIRQQADRLLGPEVTDVDGNREDRSDTISVFNGRPPSIQIFTDESQEQSGVAAWLTEQSKAGILPHEFGVFVRSEAQISRAEAAVKEAGFAFKILDEHVETTSGHVSISTMHLAKGLEFRAAVVMACDDEVIPSQDRIETVGDDTDLQEVYDTERQLLYIARTRARDHLLVTSVEPASEFLDDLANHC